MRKFVLGMSAAVLMVSAAWAQETTAPAGEEDTKVAAVDTSAAGFQKLDADSDGKISAIEAANESQVATNFTSADKDQDGYLSQEEFSQMGEMGQSETGGETSQQ